MPPPLLLRYLFFPLTLSKYLGDLTANPFDSISPSHSNRSKKFSTVKRQYGGESRCTSGGRKNDAVE
jgi:hypothetical protein